VPHVLNDTEDIVAACRRMRLIGPDEQPAITPLAGGISSLIMRVDTARGPVCVKRALPQLKVATDWFVSIERNSAEVAWIKLAAGVVPAFVPHILGEDRVGQTFAMAYLDPHHHPVWKEQLRDGIVQSSTAETVAGHLVRIHAATARREDMSKAFANQATFFAIRLEPYFAATAIEHPDLASVFQRLIETTAHMRLAVVHGDVSPKNILAGPNGPLLLDAECACYGDPAFDVAFCLTHLMLKCVWRPAYVREYFSCFDAFSATYVNAVSWESSEELEARACRLLAGMMLARVDGRSPVEYLVSHADRQRVRRFARHFLLEPVGSLDAMRTAWATEIGH
jgi:aminoglycoside phosphotransferase (APT) family kinase protein